MENNDKYTYKMRYVPLSSEVIDLKDAIFMKKDETTSNTNEIDVKEFFTACMSAIESMCAMTAMVYMKCMEKMNE